MGVGVGASRWKGGFRDKLSLGWVWPENRGVCAGKGVTEARAFGGHVRGGVMCPGWREGVWGNVRAVSLKGVWGLPETLKPSGSQGPGRPAW